jgi:hypothetical protein
MGANSPREFAWAYPEHRYPKCQTISPVTGTLRKLRVPGEPLVFSGFRYLDTILRLFHISRLNIITHIVRIAADY